MCQACTIYIPYYDVICVFTYEWVVCAFYETYVVFFLLVAACASCRCRYQCTPRRARSVCTHAIITRPRHTHTHTLSQPHKQPSHRKNSAADHRLTHAYFRDKRRPKCGALLCVLSVACSARSRQNLCAAAHVDVIRNNNFGLAEFPPGNFAGARGRAGARAYTPTSQVYLHMHRMII